MVTTDDVCTDMYHHTNCEHIQSFKKGLIEQKIPLNKHDLNDFCIPQKSKLVTFIFQMLCYCMFFCGVTSYQMVSCIL